MSIVKLPGGMRIGTGLVMGAAVVLLAPVILPVAGGVLKSLAKAGIKGGLILFEKGKLAVEETKETFEDLTAEAKAELVEEHMAPMVKPKKSTTAS
jgi:hypothetical protein